MCLTEFMAVRVELIAIEKLDRILFEAGTTRFVLVGQVPWPMPVSRLAVSYE